MANFFKSFFRRGQSEAQPAPQLAPPISFEELEPLKFEELLKRVQSLPETVPSGTMTAFVRRFLTLGLADHHVPQEQRLQALKLAEMLTQQLESVFANQPDSIAALKKANDAMFEIARTLGVGSLAWILEENSVPTDQYIPHAMKPEYRHLVPNFIEALGPEGLARSKKHMVHQLILQSDYRSRNAVFILHGLAAKGDKAAAAIFDADEYAALLGVPGDYDRGRKVLVNLGLLSPEGAARPFKPMPQLRGILALMLKDKRDESDGDPRVSDLEEGKRENLLLTLMFLRIELARSQLAQIYGNAESEEVNAIFKDPLLRNNLERFEEINGVLRKLKAGTPVDFALLDSVMRIGGIAPDTEEEFEKVKPFLEMGVAWINKERVEFLDYFRFIIRTISNPHPEMTSEADKKVLELLDEMYVQKGSALSIAERTLYHEDWVGTELS